MALGCAVFGQVRAQKYLDIQLPYLNVDFASSVHQTNGYYLGPNWGAGTTLGGLGFLAIDRIYVGLSYDAQRVKIAAFQLEDFMMKTAATSGEHDYERFRRWQAFSSYRFSLGYPMQFNNDILVFSISTNLFHTIPEVSGNFQIYSDPQNEYDHPQYERLLDASFDQVWNRQFWSARVEGSFHLGWRGYLNVYAYVNWYPGMSTDFALVDESILDPEPAIEFSEKRSLALVGIGMRFNMLWRLDADTE